jgi:sugar phosphate isomerase/epimerase
MKLGVFTVLYADKPLEETLDRLAAQGVEAVELGTGNYPGAAHCDPDRLLANPTEAAALRRAVESRGMIISALSQHGNPLHPDPERARAAHATWVKTAQLAELLEVPVVNGFSGCPGDRPGASCPNWVTCSWPEEYAEMLEWQWHQIAIPYWDEQAQLAERHGIRVALELHPGFLVYHADSMLRLRAAVGERIGANLDPSHLFWQGADPIEVIKELGRAGTIYHFHAKDTYIDKANTARNGVLDTKHYGRILDRSWTFRTVGYGHGELFWRQALSMLRTVGYDYVVSIEHEDPLASRDEGLSRAIKLLRSAMFSEPAGEMFWA